MGNDKKPDENRKRPGEFVCTAILNPKAFPPGFDPSKAGRGVAEGFVIPELDPREFDDEPPKPEGDATRPQP